MTTKTLKPPKTEINWLNENEFLKFKERRRFSNWKHKGHYYFDKIWEKAKIMTREEAYQWLGEKLDIANIENVHFSKLSEENCKKAVWICQQLLNDNRRLDLDFGVEPITPFYIL